MDWEEFNTATLKTAIYPGVGQGGTPELTYLALGLAGETGEVVDCIKKVARVGIPVTDHEKQYIDGRKSHAAEELGDVLYYWMRLVDALGFKPEMIMQATIDKLEKRRLTGTLAIRP